MSHNIHELTAHLKMEPIIAWAEAGSKLYNLSTPTSDTDIFIITEGKALKGKQNISGEIDLRLTPFEAYYQQIRREAISEIDLLMSNTLEYTENTPYKNILEDFRPNPYWYYSNSNTLALKFMPKMNAEIRETRAQYKSLKTSLRAIILGHRMLEQRLEFTPQFTTEQAEIYWKSLEEFTERFSNGENWENIHESIHKLAIKMTQ